MRCFLWKHVYFNMGMFVSSQGHFNVGISHTGSIPVPIQEMFVSMACLCQCRKCLLSLWWHVYFNAGNVLFDDMHTSMQGMFSLMACLLQCGRCSLG